MERSGNPSTQPGRGQASAQRNSLHGSVYSRSSPPLEQAQFHSHTQPRASLSQLPQFHSHTLPRAILSQQHDHPGHAPASEPPFKQNNLFHGHTLPPSATTGETAAYHSTTPPSSPSTNRMKDTFGDAVSINRTPYHAPGPRPQPNVFRHPSAASAPIRPQPSIQAPSYPVAPSHTTISHALYQRPAQNSAQYPSKYPAQHRAEHARTPSTFRPRQHYSNPQPAPLAVANPPFSAYQIPPTSGSRLPFEMTHPYEPGFTLIPVPEGPPECILQVEGEGEENFVWHCWTIGDYTFREKRFKRGKHSGSPGSNGKKAGEVKIEYHR
ncbi:hypothetical protein NA57DRAFT_82334 [Rhizodiscina lignyota]|uniref:Uncharacterized protein n=1 Tax=Rhizodiscina lignyota TaxID=1504668 RepID=A0A9P4I039_9PEZI|nr:hypothetical protein NA57DRAFT_82334 [Rhizodiscina lignyota]